MGGSQHLPRLHLGAPILGLLTGQGDTPLNANSRWGTASLPSVSPHARDGLLASVTWREHGKPTIGQAANAAQNHFGRNRLCRPAGPNPDGDGTLHGQGIQTGVADLMPLSFEMHHLLRPQRAQHSNLLLTPSPTIVEILPQGLVLDGIPANANPQPQPATAEHIDFCSLLGNEGSLALR
jgi:hypothetical protein